MVKILDTIWILDIIMDEKVMKSGENLGRMKRSSSRTYYTEVQKSHGMYVICKSKRYAIYTLRIYG